MKKALLVTLIGASITTAPLASEWAKLSYTVPADSNAAATIEPPAPTNAQAQNIADQIFINSNTHELAVLSPEEMAETEGAFWPVLAYMGASAAISAALNNGINYYSRGEFLGWKGTMYSAAAGSVGGIYSGLGAKAGGLLARGVMGANGLALSSTINATNPFRNNPDNNYGRNTIVLDPIYVDTTRGVPYRNTERYTPPNVNHDRSIRPWRHESLSDKK